MKHRHNKLISNIIMWLVIVIIALGLASFMTNTSHNSENPNISYTTFQTKLKHHKVQSVHIEPSSDATTDKIIGTYKKSMKHQHDNKYVKHFHTTILNSNPTIQQTQSKLEQYHVKITNHPAKQQSEFMQIAFDFAPMLLFILFIYWMYKRSGASGLSGSKGIFKKLGKSYTKASKKSKVRFSDVAGEDAEKHELMNIVDVLKHPKKYKKLGAKVPHGILLEGPPGTGKTLLAKATAGESNVPFYYANGASFVKVFVGAGASRVHQLFTVAKKHAPSIIFIDEIDGIGAKRSKAGNDDERKHTLNQLLTEMDGFDSKHNVIVIGATNRADMLDSALTRPGRFDMKVYVGRPDVRGRYQILKVHARNKPLAKNCNLKELARQTPGFVGADLANLLNDAALLAARNNRSTITNADLEESEDRVIGGPAKKGMVISPKDEKIIANHEAGHTIVGMVLKHAQKVHKVTIIPRGRAGGFTLMLPNDGEYLTSKRDALEQLAGFMGGRIAEQKRFNGLRSSGASNDFQKATKLAYAMVTKYGMSNKLGNVSFVPNAYGKPIYSEHTGEIIDTIAHIYLTKATNMAKEVMNTHYKQQQIITKALLKYETLDATDLKSLYKTGHMPTGRAIIIYPDGSYKYFD